MCFFDRQKAHLQQKARRMPPVKIEYTSRRDVLVAGTAAFALMAILGIPSAGAQEAKGPAVAPEAWEEAVKKIMGDAKPADGKIQIELQEIAENGNMVPFSLAIDSPMTEADHVKAIHLVATANPQAVVGSFFFTPLSGKASISGRMRLARTQDVIVVAALSDGRFLMGRRMVKVTIGGCGG
jgi:sulfur-oxidizing protein SoxY